MGRERCTEEILRSEMEPGRDASEGQQKRQEGTLAGEETVVGSWLLGGHQPWEQLLSQFAHLGFGLTWPGPVPKKRSSLVWVDPAVCSCCLNQAGG